MLVVLLYYYTCLWRYINIFMRNTHTHKTEVVTLRYYIPG